MIVGACMACKVGLHEECWDPKIKDYEGWNGGETWVCCCPNLDVEDHPENRGRGADVSGVEDVTEVTSTGRKRAAMVAPIFPGMLCEWAGLRHAGGGPHPIVGCKGNTIADVKRNADLPSNATRRGERHHGPNKNVLENTPGVNLHRICSACHTHWHTLNDRYYSEERPNASTPWMPMEEFTSFPHDPITKATDEELELAEAWWATRTESRKTPYPFPPKSE